MKYINIIHNIPSFHCVLFFLFFSKWMFRFWVFCLYFHNSFIRGDFSNEFRECSICSKFVEDKEPKWEEIPRNLLKCPNWWQKSTTWSSANHTFRCIKKKWILVYSSVIIFTIQSIFGYFYFLWTQQHRKYKNR